MRKKYRVLVIGCGRAGVGYEADESYAMPRSHSGAAAANPKTELAALADADEKKLKIARRFFPKAEIFRDAAWAFEKTRPDIAIIATPTNTHAEIAKLVCSAKTPIIICEKPLCVTLQEASSIAKAVEVSRPTFAVNYSRRFFPSFIRLRSDIFDGKYGKIKQISCDYSDGLLNIGGHAIDIIHFLTGQHTVRVSGKFNREHALHPPGDEDVDGIIELENGVTATLNSKGPRGVFRLGIFGTKGKISMTEKKKESFFQGVLDEAIRCFEEKCESISGLQNGTETLAVCRALKESAGRDGDVILCRK